MTKSNRFRLNINHDVNKNCFHNLTDPSSEDGTFMLKATMFCSITCSASSVLRIPKLQNLKNLCMFQPSCPIDNHENKDECRTIDKGTSLPEFKPLHLLVAHLFLNFTIE